MYILSTGQFLGTAKHVKNNGRQEKNKIDFFCFGNTVFLFHKRPTLRESQTFYDIYNIHYTYLYLNGHSHKKNTWALKKEV